MIYKGQDNIIDFEAFKKKLSETKAPSGDRLNDARACISEINEILKKYKMNITSVPQLEIIAPGVFRLVGDLGIRPKD